MKKLAIIIASIVLLVPISQAFAGNAAWRGSQSRMRKAYLKWQKQEAEFWKKFDAEMVQAERDLDGKSYTPVKRRK